MFGMRAIQSMQIHFIVISIGIKSTKCKGKVIIFIKKIIYKFLLSKLYKKCYYQNIYKFVLSILLV